jgi:predicted nucleotidyltransferase
MNWVERILRGLQDHDVEFIVVGMMAATLQKSPLRTEDVDICPEPSVSNLRRLASALNDLGAQEWEPHKGEFVERVWTAEMLAVDPFWLLGVDGDRLDLVFEPAGTTGYRDLIKDAVHKEIDGLVVTVASLRDIVRSKETLGREKDRAQLPTLRRLIELMEERDEEGPSNS